MIEDKNRCQGYVLPGSFMTFGPRTWQQCENQGIVMLTVIQNKKKETMPACAECWQRCIDNKIKIVSAVPIIKEKSNEQKAKGK